MARMTYAQATNAALRREMKADGRVFIYGIGAPDHKRVFGTHDGLVEKFGRERVLDTPLSEDALMGFGLGAALGGLRPVNVHIRVDFLLLAMNQLVNMVASHQMVTGRPVPLVIRAIVGRGWGQGCHHSKSMHATFAHIPGLTVVAPSRPADAFAMLSAAIRSDDPVLLLEHRWLYWAEGDVPARPRKDALSGAMVLREGGDLTVVATSWMVVEALHAADIIERHHGVSLEVVDVRSLRPLDTATISTSVIKTGHCLVVDNDWDYCGFGAEVAASVQRTCFAGLRKPVSRMAWHEFHVPTARPLENQMYEGTRDIVMRIEDMLGLPRADLAEEEFYAHEKKFKGPF